MPVYVIRVFRLSCRIWKTCPAGGLQPRLFSPMFHVPGFFSALPIASCTRTVPSSPGTTDTAVIVFSRAGNTRKVADAIAAEPGVPVQDTNAPLPESARLVFPGSGGYGGKPGEPLMQFIGSGNFSGRKAALSGTSGGAEGAQHMIAVMGDVLLAKGATVIGDFTCRGKFLFTNRGHPGAQDLADAKTFAREMAGSA